MIVRCCSFLFVVECIGCESNLGKKGAKPKFVDTKKCQFSVTENMLPLHYDITLADATMTHNRHNEKARLHLWIDTDPSGLVWTGLDCDDDLAVLAALALEQRGEILLEGVSICGGNAPLLHTRRDVKLLLKHAGALHINPVCGAGWRSMQVGWKSLRFFSWLYPDMENSNDAAQALLTAVENAPPNSLTILTLGPPTNLANALQQAPWMAQRLEHVYMMGGELTSSRLDLNFISDRAAARLSVQANVPTTLIPIQTCAQVAFTQEHLDSFQDSCCPRATACALLPKMKQQVQLMPWLVNQHVSRKMTQQHVASPNLLQGFIPWDLVAFMAVVHPKLFDEWQNHLVEFPGCDWGEPCDGNMIVSAPISFSVQNHSNIVRIPHRLRNETEFMQVTMDLLCQMDAHGSSPPRLVWGFLNQIAGLLIAMLVLTKMLWQQF